MASSWPGGGEGGGGTASDPNEILVFGYACKLFRDDDKARWIEEERHLIPWMGDTSVKIDRYDGRGHLPDLQGYGGDTGGAEAIEAVPPYIDKDEFERQLEIERYRDLGDEGEEGEGKSYLDDRSYQEQEFRRFQSDVNDSMMKGGGGCYAQIGYSYDDEDKERKTEEVAAEGMVAKVDDERPFEKPAGLILPSGILLPPTMKVHNIIEKTAKFIASHGSQMEIILKTKQANNPLFNFLDYKDELNPYFKFLVNAIRDNVYTPEEEKAQNSEETENQLEDCNSNSEDEEGYLHPSLFRNSDLTTVPLLKFKSKQENSAYSLLVSKIRGTTNTDTPSPPPNNSHQQNSNPPYQSANGSSSSYNSQQYPHQSNCQPAQGYNPYGYSAEQQMMMPRPASEIPPPNDQVVIEKMASYVVKNGYAFEELARNKGDARFVFLNPSHEFHWYYLNCKERFRAESSAVVANSQFVSYKKAPETHVPKSKSANTSTSLESAPFEQKRIVLKSVELPLSESGIPIANLESISNRPTTLPPELASRIEQLKSKSAVFAKKEPTAVPKIHFSTSIGKKMNIGDPEAAPSDMSKEDIDTEKAIPITEFESNLPKNLKQMKVGQRTENVRKNSDDETVPENESRDRERLRKIRREKAALFLEKLRAKNNNSPDPASIQTNNNKADTVISTKENQEVSSNPALVDSRLQACDTPDKSAVEDYDKKYHRKRRRSRSRSGSRSSRSKRSRSRSSVSYSSDSDSSGSGRKKKRSKRRSSKKRKRKHKKSKKHKR